MSSIEEQIQLESSEYSRRASSARCVGVVWIPLCRNSIEFSRPPGAIGAGSVLDEGLGPEQYRLLARCIRLRLRLHHHVRRGWLAGGSARHCSGPGAFSCRVVTGLCGARAGGRCPRFGRGAVRPRVGGRCLFPGGKQRSGRMVSAREARNGHRHRNWGLRVWIGARAAVNGVDSSQFWLARSVCSDGCHWLGVGGWVAGGRAICPVACCGRVVGARKSQDHLERGVWASCGVAHSRVEVSHRPGFLLLYVLDSKIPFQRTWVLAGPNRETILDSLPGVGFEQYRERLSR